MKFSDMTAHEFHIYLSQTREATVRRNEINSKANRQQEPLEGRPSINAEDDDKYNVITFAADKGYPMQLAYAIENGADIKIDSRGRDPYKTAHTLHFYGSHQQLTSEMLKLVENVQQDGYKQSSNFYVRVQGGKPVEIGMVDKNLKQESFYDYQGPAKKPE